MASLSLQNISKQFGNTQAVQDITLDVNSGEFLSILGPSGCGKTTLLRMVAGFESPTAGKILIDGRDITHQPPQTRNIGMVFQNYALFPHMTVFGNIAFGLEARKIPKKEITARVERVVDAVHLTDKIQAVVPTLSGGEQQRVAVARAIVIEPKVLLFDEPLSNLDVSLRLSTREEIRALQRSIGITTIYVTHDQSEAMSLSDRIAVMRKGRLEQLDAPAILYESPASEFVAGFLGGANICEGEIISGSSLRFGLKVISIPEVPRLKARRVVLAIKPETIALHSSGDFEGKLDDIEYLGLTTNFTVSFDGMRFRGTAMSSAETRKVKVGSTQRFNIDWARCSFFQD